MKSATQTFFWGKPTHKCPNYLTDLSEMRDLRKVSILDEVTVRGAAHTFTANQKLEMQNDSQTQSNSGQLVF